jgi:antitoxin ParD1/3/4
MATNVNLTPELEKFARVCVTEGKYNNVSEVVRSALRLLQETELQKQNFNLMLDAVRQETELNGSHALDDVWAK